MKTILILTGSAGTDAAIREALDPDEYRALTRRGVFEAEAELERGLIDAAIIDVELTDVHAVRLIGEVREAVPRCPIVVFCTEKKWEWEEEAYLLGVAHVLSKPVRAKLLNSLLGRFCDGPPVLDIKSEVIEPPSDSRFKHAISEHLRALQTLRDFSGVLTHSLNTDALLQRFLFLLREIMGVNRAVVFLRKPSSGFGRAPEDRSLRSACATGFEKSFLDHFTLSAVAGIGGYLRRAGRILRARSSEARSNREIQKEFQLLGTEVAIPIFDSESLLGVAAFDDRLNGDPYSNEELALIFHMLEEVGLAIRNTWLHDQISANNGLITDILGHLASGCIVAGPGPILLHANPAAHRFLNAKELCFADLPQELGSRIFAVLNAGPPQEPFKYSFPGTPQTSCLVTITPFKTQTTSLAALLLIEDITQSERSQRLEIEASNLRLIKSMAEHLAHEIGNSLVPISTHQQLLAEKFNDPEFRESMATALGSGVKRITRLADQMLFLAREPSPKLERVRISQLIIDAFREVNTHHPDKVARLNFDKSSAPWTVAGDAKALRHAFSEVLLNALQANPSDPAVSVKMERSENGGGHPLLQVEVNDSGEGFSDEAARNALDPFFSTRSVGFGLGLTVTRKIIEDHHGTLEIPPRSNGGQSSVRISLPLEVDE